MMIMIMMIIIMVIMISHEIEMLQCMNLLVIINKHCSLYQIIAHCPQHLDFE